MCIVLINITINNDAFFPQFNKPSSQLNLHVALIKNHVFHCCCAICTVVHSPINICMYRYYIYIQKQRRRGVKSRRGENSNLLTDNNFRQRRLWVLKISMGNFSPKFCILDRSFRVSKISKLLNLTTKKFPDVLEFTVGNCAP